MGLLTAIVIIILSPFLFVLGIILITFVFYLVALIVLGIVAIFEMVINIFRKRK